MKTESTDPPQSAPWWADSAASTTPTPDERYESGGELGRGGMGIVTAEWDGWLDRNIARKRIRPELVQEHRDRLLREARVTARLVHPGIVPIYDIGEDELGEPFYTMPILHGRSLGAAISDEQTSLVWLVRALVDACEAVGYAHAHDVVHRDLTPSNILLGEHGQVWVMDWGLAQDPAASSCGAEGTPGFASPEQQAGGAIHPTSDVWSLGAILHAILGRGDPQRSPPREPRALVAIARRACETRPDARYVDAAALGRDLQRWLDGGFVKAHAYSSWELVSLLAARWAAPIGVAAIALIALAALVVAFIVATQAERDRAIAAEQEAQHALAEARSSTAAAFELEAKRALDAGNGVEAEVFASRSLELRESPGARGVLLATEAWEPAILVGQEPMPDCEHWTQTLSGDRLVCWTGEELSVVPLDGEPGWRRTAPEVHSPDDPVGIHRAARAYGDRVLAIRAAATLQVWSAGEVIASRSYKNGGHRLFGTSRPVISDGVRLGLVDLDTAEVSWGPRWCTVVLDVIEVPDGLLAACEGGIRSGPLHSPGPLIGMPEDPSVVAWAQGPLVGTYQGSVWSAEGVPERLIRVGAPIQGLHGLGRGRLAVRDEHQRMSVWSIQSGDLLARIPGRTLELRESGEGEWLALGDERRRFRIPERLRARGLRAVDDGGAVWLARGPRGHMAVGHGSGAVDVWREDEPTRLRIPSGPGRISKAGVFTTDGDLLITQLGGAPLRMHDPDTGQKRAEYPVTSIRRLAVSGRFILSGGYRHVVGVWDPATDTRTELVLPGWVSDFVVRGDQIWIADEEGGVWTASGLDSDAPILRSRFRAAGAGFLAVGDSRVIHATDQSVVATSPDGEPLWAHELPDSVSAVAIAGRWTLVGERTGQITVLDETGSVRASVHGHERLVSDLLVVGDTAWSASWDGRVLRWDLGAIELDGAALSERAVRRHRLTAEHLVEVAP